MKTKLYQCPYERATKCCMDDGCAGCEHFKQLPKLPNDKEIEKIAHEKYFGMTAYGFIIGAKWMRRKI